MNSYIAAVYHIRETPLPLGYLGNKPSMRRNFCIPCLSQFWSAASKSSQPPSECYTLYPILLRILWLRVSKRSNIKKNSPSYYGSVDWALACVSKGCWFDSQSGHMPGFRARSPVGGMQEATTHWCLSLPSPLSKNKINKS